MRTFFRIITAAAAAAALVSCQKESTPDNTVDEQISYMDSAAEEALTQIVPSDFQTLANLTKALPQDSLNLEFDEASQTRLGLLALSLMKIKGLVIDMDKISGTFTINGTKATYTSGSGLKMVYIAGSDTYTADLSFTKGTKEVKLGTMDGSQFGLKNDPDVYLIVPTAVKVNISCNEKLYMGADLKMDLSGMSDDWSSLTADQIDATVRGTAFIGGTGSYKADISSLKIANSKCDAEGTLYGNKGAFLFSGVISTEFTPDGEGNIEIDSATAEIYGNLIDKVETKKRATVSDSALVDIFLAKSASCAMTVDSESETVTFSNGIVKSTSEVFTQQNFPKTFQSVTSKVIEFAAIFGDTWMSSN